MRSPAPKAPPEADHAGGLPHVVDPNAVYTVEVFQAALGLRKSTVRREVREKRLRVSRRAGRYFILGAWILEWLAAGVSGREQQAPPGANGHRLSGADKMPGR